MRDLPGELEAHTDGDVIAVLDFTPDDSLLTQRVARELVNRFQKLRKKAGLQPADAVTMSFSADTESAAALAAAIAPEAPFLEESLGGAPVDAAALPEGGRVLGEEATSVQLPSGEMIDFVARLTAPAST